MIECNRLSRSFRVYEKKPGLKGSLAQFFHRDYRVSHAVDGFDLNIAQGEFVGLLGPNGAGKTTLMKMLTGIIVPSSGRATVAGHEPHRREIQFRKQIALVMGQKSQLWWDIPAMDSFLLLQRYYEIAEDDFRRRLGELSELLGVSKLLHVHIRKLSLGERMKMELMACILHDPQVIFLDEPTIGLDVIAQKNIREFLASYQKKKNVTVVLTSHYMADVQSLCSRIVLILAGRKRFDGPISEFEGILGREKSISLRFERPQDPQDQAWNGMDPAWSNGNTQVDIRLPEARMRTTLAELLVKYPVVDVVSEKMAVERVMETLLKSPELIPVLPQTDGARSDT
jgi:ABC-2 type transport system ATP-binding protein